MPPGAIRPATLSFRSRLAEIGRGIALPFAIQGIYLVCVPLAAREGVGAVTSFGYAYLIASAIVAVTGSSLGLVTSVPLTRAGLDPGRIVASRRLVRVARDRRRRRRRRRLRARGRDDRPRSPRLGLQRGRGGRAGRLVVVFSLWAVVSVGISLTFPLLFVVRAGRRLPLLALLTIVVQIPLAVIGQLTLGLDGLALALAATTAFVLASLLVDLDALRPTARGLLIAAVTVALFALVAFVPPSLVLAPAAAAAFGLALYVVVLGLARPAPLRDAWRYLRALA